jgi:hypothetical protein
MKKCMLSPLLLTVVLCFFGNASLLNAHGIDTPFNKALEDAEFAKENEIETLQVPSHEEWVRVVTFQDKGFGSHY